jgi:hypothetical protein
MLSLLAEGRPPGNPWDRPELLVATVAIAGALLAGGVVLYFVDRWRKRGERPEEGAVSELTGFRGMLERGEITEEEYQKLRNKVAGRLKPAAPAGAAPTSPAATDPTNGTTGPAAPPLPGPLPDDYFDDPQPPAPPAHPR